MTLPYLTFPANSISTPFYNLSFSLGEKYTYIRLDFRTTALHTSDLPATIPVLMRDLPNIFDSTCFNDYNYSFRKEVEDTELGHLFEHILLEYLCTIALSMKGGGEVVFRGETKWNWAEDERGVFHVYLSSGLTYAYAFKKALQKAIDLINKIIKESEGSVSVPRPAYAGSPAYVPNR